MCGIVGYIGGQQAEPIVLAGLAKLEYRGYDSAGVCTIDGNRAEVRVVHNGLPRASAVTLVDGSALVLIELTKAVVVPYTPR